MVAEVVIRPIGQPVQFFFLAKWEIEFEIDGSFGIKCPIFSRDLMFKDLGHIQTNIFHPRKHFLPPHLEGFLPVGRPDKIFYLHLFELAGPEEKITGSDLVAESFAYLTETERQ